jgi:hypothetical protein
VQTKEYFFRPAVELLRAEEPFRYYVHQPEWPRDGNGSAPSMPQPPTGFVSSSFFNSSVMCLTRDKCKKHFSNTANKTQSFFVK